jgi:hypothetical protein
VRPTSLPSGRRTLRTEGGEDYTLLYQGRRGGGAGPDFRDAVPARLDGARLRGDVELHLRARDWQAHGHAADPRYNAVVLHVVLVAPGANTRRASGAVALVVLRPSGSDAEVSPPTPPFWPCTGLSTRLGASATRTLLLAAARWRRPRTNMRLAYSGRAAIGCSSSR